MTTYRIRINIEGNECTLSRTGHNLRDAIDKLYKDWPNVDIVEVVRVVEDDELILSYQP